jgi:hypothetical protein
MKFGKVLSAIIFFFMSASSFATLDLGQLTYKSGKEASITANFRLDTIAIMEHGYAFSLDAPLGRGWTMGPSVFHFPQNYSFLKFSATGVGLTFLKYFNGKAFHSGWYGGPMVYYVQGDSDSSQLGSGPQAFEFGERAGYQWMWNRFNVQLGAALVYLPALDSLTGFNADLNVGFAL